MKRSRSSRWPECAVKIAKRPGDGLVREEYRALRQLRSPALPVPIAYFILEEAGATWPAIVVDYVDGQTLTAWAETASIRARIAVLADLATALQVLASVGGRHGDLGGGNVMVEAGERVRLIDPDGSSLGRSSRLPGTKVRDVAEFTGILQSLIIAPDDRAIAPLISLMTGDRTPEFGQAASHLRDLLAHRLPSEVIGDLQPVAAVAGRDRDARQALYCKIRDTRETAIRTLFERANLVLTAFGCRPPPYAVGTVDLYKSELAAEGNPSGMFLQRSQQFVAPDGEEFHLGFQGSNEFRKPWPFPAKEGLVSKGFVNVLLDHQPLVSDELEWWFLNGVSRFVVLEGNRYIEFDDARLERLAKILIDVTYPALASPVRLEPPNGIGLTVLQRYTPFIEQLGLDNGLEQLPRNWFHINLAHKPWPDITGVSIGSGLSTIFDTPKALRRALVKQVGAAIAARAMELFYNIYRVDVTVIDEVNRSLAVDVEARPVRSNAVQWHFDLSFPKGLVTV